MLAAPVTTEGPSGARRGGLPKAVDVVGPGPDKCQRVIPSG